nr:hypothetical protein CFP56_33598 [Quercus suber]
MDMGWSAHRFFVSVFPVLRKETEGSGTTYRSTSPCPTRYPSPSSRKTMPSLVSSLTAGKPKLVITVPASSVSPATLGTVESRTDVDTAADSLGAPLWRRGSCAVVVVVAAAEAGLTTLGDGVGLWKIRLRLYSSKRTFSWARSWSVRRCASGTSSMSKKSRAEAANFGLMMSSSRGTVDVGDLVAMARWSSNSRMCLRCSKEEGIWHTSGGGEHALIAQKSGWWTYPSTCDSPERHSHALSHHRIAECEHSCGGLRLNTRTATEHEAIPPTVWTTEQDDYVVHLRDVAQLT